MHDTIDLAQVVAKIAAQRRQTRLTQIAALIVGVSLGALVIVTDPSMQSGRLRALSEQSEIFLILAIIVAVQVTFWIERGLEARYLARLMPAVKQKIADLPLPAFTVHRLVHFVSLRAILYGVAYVIVFGLYALSNPAQPAFATFFTLSIAFLFVYFMLTRLIAVITTRLFFSRNLRAGHYIEALADSQRARRRLPLVASYRVNQGLVQLWAGQPNEAEAHYRGLLSVFRHDTALLSIVLCNLGAALMEQERYAEALPYLESALLIAPQNPAIYATLAQYYLSQQLYPERALELMEFIYSGARMPKAKNLYTSLGYSLPQSLYALTLAVNERDARADAALQNALDTVDQTFVPAYGGVLFNAGATRQQQGDGAAARDFFEQARRIDPRGQTARLAEKALAEG